MTVLAVDLAAKYSAACVMRDDHLVKSEFDSWGLDEFDFVESLTWMWTLGPRHKFPEVLIVEDLPHGLRYSTIVKQVCRIQGRIAEALDRTSDGSSKDLVFVSPAQWRSHFKGLERGTGPTAVVPVAAEFGYQPPANLLDRAKGNGGKTRADKVATDYCSAYLIARWAIDMKQQHGTYDVPGTSRYDTREIRTKEFNDKNV